VSSKPDLSFRKYREIDIPYLAFLTADDFQVQSLVKITIVKGTVPAYRKGCPAHNPSCGFRVERCFQRHKVVSEVSTVFQIVKVPSDGTVDQTVKSIETHSVDCPQHPTVFGFQMLLFARQICPDRVMDEVENKPASRLPVSQTVEKPYCFDGPSENIPASLPVRSLPEIIRERSHYLNPVGREHGRKMAKTLLKKNHKV
jgi:hypothetical protein